MLKFVAVNFLSFALTELKSFIVPSLLSKDLVLKKTLLENSIKPFSDSKFLVLISFDFRL